MTNTERIQANNADLQDCIEIAKNLPDAGGSGGEESIQLINYVTTLINLFRSSTFPENTSMILQPILITGAMISISGMCNATKNLTYLKIDYSTDLKWSVSSAFKRCYQLKEVDLGKKIAITGSALDMFSYAEALETIHTELDFSDASTLSGVFSRCIRLINLKVTENSIKKSVSLPLSTLLSDASIQSIIDGLADLTGGTAQTLTVHKDVRAKIESNPEQLATIIEKNWTLASA